MKLNCTLSKFQDKNPLLKNVHKISIVLNIPTLRMQLLAEK